MKRMSKVQVLRYFILTFFLVFVTVMSFRHQIIGGGPKGSPSVDAICPFGGLESIYQVVTKGEFLKRTYTSNMILLSGTIILAVLLGRFFCGWICALGWMQEIFGKLGRLIFKKKRFIIPSSVDKWLRYVKYIILAVIIYFTWKAGDMVVRAYDPFAAYAHLPSGFGELLDEFLIGTVILFGSLLISVFYERFFCKYICPLGAFLGILSKISPFAIYREKKTCTHCDLCNTTCQMNIEIAQVEKVRSAECIGCLECVTVCPTKKETLKVKSFGVYVRPVFVALIGVGIYLVIVLFTNLTGVWKTGETTLDAVVTKEQKLDPYSIRGFMTLHEISETFGIELEVLYKELGITEAVVPSDMKSKEIKNIAPGVDEYSIRIAVDTILKRK
ncbi:MAG: hypothetical protein A2015_04705 [Spirochaetes bacterium GWF1_31_7]|nr:MAG: hypothetical protein A2Y30_05085 [Spirochaetes bacterium GWE1_32_154]OHD48769.1 MAG: hypothetical protein A2Y29_03060 [Spirochaetes bacterium GWE2_31_10]OHD52832.1 MAG: hypothetical protein A2015_04705 [Spirochaetes bacterium GWF1_31_7]OHD81493.1 MAG: hypothetical protein A2355_00800 [Spirochaetes bacterium RIFOXYB1_FULL_32_8]HBD95190.1 4Fe-4S ferredoxin [Spirochaetia bacterium]